MPGIKEGEWDWRDGKPVPEGGWGTVKRCGVCNGLGDEEVMGDMRRCRACGGDGFVTVGRDEEGRRSS